MQISLRKANAFQIAINEALKGLEFKAEISINEFQDPTKEIEAGSTTFAKNIVRRNDLLAALYEIRKSVSVANSDTGIDARLADVARFDKDIAFFAAYLKTAPRTELKVITGKLDKIRNREGESYSYHSSEVATSIFNQTDIDQFRGIVSTVKKSKQKIQDELLELNVRTQIELSATTVATLTTESIL
jgi:hypothetical protein